MKVGILTRDIDKLDNWELMIFEYILGHPGLELALLIKDKRAQDRPLFRGRLASGLFRLQTRIESTYYKTRGRTVDANSIAEEIAQIDTIYLSPVRDGDTDVFSADETATVNGYNLDLLFQHEFGIIGGDILSSARYGVWSFYYADGSVDCNAIAGFREITDNHPYCCITLRQLSVNADGGGYVLDRAWCERHWAFVKNREGLLETAAVLLSKNIDKLLRQGEINTAGLQKCADRTALQPGVWQVVGYMTKFGIRLCATVFNERILPGRYKCWALFFGKGDFSKAGLSGIKPLEMPKGVLRGDPFLFEHCNQLYAFFEEYSYKRKLGKISCGVIAGENGEYSIVDVKDVLVRDHHLSYPQIFEEDGDIYLIPETRAAKRVEVYRCVSFPDKWELYATAFDGEEIVDTTYYRDENGDRWLFLSKGRMFKPELHIFKIDSLKLKEITAHRENPIFIDCRKGRSGGAIFKRGYELLRPSQVSTYGTYGNGLEISRVKKLTLEEFEDEPVMTIKPDFRKGLLGIHHMHQYGDSYIFDAQFKRW